LGVTYVDTQKRLRYPTIAKRAIALKKSADSLSEELRVLYVAMTRARDRLIMTYASKFLEKAISEYARRMDFSENELIVSDVASMGEWVLQTAMRRIEAGALFAIGGRPSVLKTDGIPWQISVIEGSVDPVVCADIQEDVCLLPEVTMLQLKEGLSFVYPHKNATAFPSKQTATQLKGREKDKEVHQDVPEHKRYYSWRKPSFVEEYIDPLVVGTATHKALQYLRFEGTPSDDTIQAGLAAVRDEGRLTQEEYALIDQTAVIRFYRSKLGMQLVNSKHVLREFKLSILLDGTKFDETLTDDRVLLQGVVDCAILDDDGITVIDFKTDAVTEDTVMSVAEGYRRQVTAYAEALSRIFALPIKRAVLYFLRIGRDVDVD
jgi:ATP-dependent helicase/nuclease subunit A